jgi:2-methylcitrate dehydratase PrpD
MAEETTQALARYAAQLEHDDIPEGAKAHCKALLLDALACAIAGHRGEEIAQVTAFANALAPGAGASILGGGQLSLTGGTILNAFLITSVTMCDAHRPTLTHVTPEVVPPALAIAERDNLSGAALLTALAVGFEVTTRVGIGLDYPRFRGKGWHGPGVLGPFGAAAAVGRLLGADAETMARSFGLAGSQSAGTFAAWGTPTVKFHQCRGALSGLMAALLAQQGFVATRSFLTAPDGGLYSTYSDGGHPERVTDDLGTRWELQQIALRAWPGAVAIQGLITALFDLIGQHSVPVGRVTHVDVRLSPFAFDMHGGYATYNGKFEALLSAHYVAAAILHDRDLSLDQFEPGRYDAPLLKQFAAERVTVAADPNLSGPQCSLAIELADGTKLSMLCEQASGAPERPLTQQQVEAKFRRYAGGRLSPAQIDGVVQAVENLEHLASVRDLMAMLTIREGAV